jgi:hypothetical protein
MKISFEDGSFIHIDEAIRGDKVITITMCGLKNDGKTLTMSTSDLDDKQVVEIIEFLSEASKKVE